MASRLVVFNVAKDAIKFFKLHKHGVHAVGKIAEVRKTPKDLDGVTLYYPVIEYYYNNQIFHFAPIDEGTRGKPQLGGQVKIIHDQINPERAILNSNQAKFFICFKSFFALALLSGLVGGFFLVI